MFCSIRGNEISCPAALIGTMTNARVRALLAEKGVSMDLGRAGGFASDGNILGSSRWDVANILCEAISRIETQAMVGGVVRCACPEDEYDGKSF